MTVATTDGDTSLGVSLLERREVALALLLDEGATTLRELHPELEVLSEVGDEARLIVSEPIRELEGAWNEVPESSYGIVQPGQDELHPFQPRANGS